MRFVKMSELNQPEIQLFIRASQQVFPFFISNSQAQAEIIKAIEENQTEMIGMEEAGRLVALIVCQQSAQELVIRNFQVTTKFLHKKNSVNYWLGQIEKLAKLKRASSLALTIELLNQPLVKSLLAADFNLSSETHNGKFTKDLKYQTAIVLAGGGARGAYQIGAWRALEELDVGYQLITGTSVGALNGGLILQGDMAAAETMWNEIDTGKILSFPNTTPSNGFTMTQMVKDIQRFALSAVSHQGVSTAPLKKLITDVLDEEKIRQNTKELLICTTQLPSFKEVVVSLQETPTGEFAKWLLASSSFFPAMAAAKIADTYYVDGGYRNNIPIDVALKKGATELIVIDVKGPGITKQTPIPEAVPLLKVASPWSLGTVLLFDGNRSKWNQQLGYLETMKGFGCYLGHWYTFDHEMTDRALREWHDRLFKNIFHQFNQAEKELFRKPLIIEELLKKMRNLYHDRVTTATISLYILECVGKVLGVSPTVLYTVPTMETVIHEALNSDWLSLNQESENMLLSLQEWLMLYADESVLPTEKRQIVFIYQKLLESPDDPLLIRVARLVPHLYLVAKTLVWLSNNQLAELRE